MGDFITAYSNMVDAHKAHTEELPGLKNKIAYLEDCSRRNNIKFRGILETIKSNKITIYPQGLFHKLFLDPYNQVQLFADTANCHSFLLSPQFSGNQYSLQVGQPSKPRLFSIWHRKNESKNPITGTLSLPLHQFLLEKPKHHPRFQTPGT